MQTQKIIIITGHYGCGKTNTAVNLALALRKSGKPCTVADLDIVNPFFRTADFARLFKENDIKLAVSGFANTNIDVPALNLNIKALTSGGGVLIIDSGGDDEGAKALGRFADDISETGYDMYYVINKYRFLTRSAIEAAELMRDIETASRLKCTGVFNNSNLGKATEQSDIDESVPYAEEVSRLVNLPLIELPAKIFVKPLWEV